MYNVGDTFTPTPYYARLLGLNLWDVYTICKIDPRVVYWDGPGLSDLGGYGDGVSARAVLEYLIPTSICLENK